MLHEIKAVFYECSATLICLTLAGFFFSLAQTTYFYSFRYFFSASFPLFLSCSITLKRYLLVSFLFYFIVPDVSVCPSPVHAAGAKVKDLEDEADRLLEKLQPIKKLQDNLRRNISQIKELINQARKQANSVSHICDN